MKAIETLYKGYRFRSRLEARWAVFFDTLGLHWEYEPEGYELGDGIRYLPDFYVDDFIHAEVKPGMVTSDEIGKMEKFLYSFPDGYGTMFLLHPFTKKPEHWVASQQFEICQDCKARHCAQISFDGITTCPECKRLAVWGMTNSSSVHCIRAQCGYVCESASPLTTDNLYRTMNAIQAARSARFEFGR